jgi:FAD/FMN-containing dehydrogenase
MNINYKKCLKIVTLVITAILIGSVSAATYSYMYIQGSGSITSGGLSWAKGGDAPAGATVVGAYVTNMNFSIPVNSPRNFTDSLHLINADTSPHTFSIESTVTAGNTTKFSAFDMAIYQSGGARVAKISIKSGGSASGLTIQGSETLYIRFEINPLTDAASGYLAFTVKLTYLVA